MKIGFKRFLSWLIDIIILGIIMMLLTNYVFPNKENIEKLGIEEDYLANELLEGQIEASVYLERTALVSYDMAKEKIPNVLCSIILIIIFQIIFPYIMKGQTIGQKIVKVKTLKDDNSVDINDYIVRSLILYFVFIDVILLVLIYVVTGLIYYYISVILTLIGIILIAVNALMIIFSKTKTGLYDRITKTKVKECEVIK